MIKNKKFLWMLLLVMASLIAIQVWAPRPIDWSLTLSHEDRIPYGTYIFQEELQTRFPETRPVVNETWYEICNSTDLPDLVMSISNNHFADSVDAQALLHYVNRGGTAFISSSDFYGWLADTLNLTIDGAWTGSLNLELLDLGKDSTAIHFVNESLNPHQSYYYRKPAIYTYFSTIDTLSAQVIAVNEKDFPVMILMPWGKGKLILSTTPIAFSNYYMLKQPNQQFVANALSYLTANSVVHTEYYQLGRQEARTPLRFIVSDPALKWAYYIAIISLILFVVFEAKRRQRVIPIIPPLKNTTLDFTQTVARLYYEQGDNKNIAHKMVSYFLEDIRANFYLSTNQWDEDFLQQLSQKSNRSINEVKSLFNMMTQLLSATNISDGQLVELNERINRFRIGAAIKY